MAGEGVEKELCLRREIKTIILPEMTSKEKGVEEERLVCNGRLQELEADSLGTGVGLLQFF